MARGLVTSGVSRKEEEEKKKTKSSKPSWEEEYAKKMREVPSRGTRTSYQRQLAAQRALGDTTYIYKQVPAYPLEYEPLKVVEYKPEKPKTSPRDSHYSVSDVEGYGRVMLTSGQEDYITPLTKMEKKISTFEYRMIGAGRELGKEAQEALKEKRYLEAFGKGTAAVSARTGAGIIGGVTFYGRPLSWDRTAKGLIQSGSRFVQDPLGSTKRFIGKVSRDPGSIAQFGGAVAGGYSVELGISTLRGTKSLKRVEEAKIDVKSTTLKLTREGVEGPLTIVRGVTKTKRLPSKVYDIVSKELDDIKGEKIAVVRERGGTAIAEVLDIGDDAVSKLLSGKRFKTTTIESELKALGSGKVRFVKTSKDLFTGKTATYLDELSEISTRFKGLEEWRKPSISTRVLEEGGVFDVKGIVGKARDLDTFLKDTKGLDLHDMRVLIKEEISKLTPSQLVTVSKTYRGIVPLGTKALTTGIMTSLRTTPLQSTSKPSTIEGVRSETIVKTKGEREASSIIDPTKIKARKRTYTVPRRTVFSVEGYGAKPSLDTIMKTSIVDDTRTRSIVTTIPKIGDYPFEVQDVTPVLDTKPTPVVVPKPTPVVIPKPTPIVMPKPAPKELPKTLTRMRLDLKRKPLPLPTEIQKTGQRQKQVSLGMLSQMRIGRTTTKKKEIPYLKRKQPKGFRWLSKMWGEERKYGVPTVKELGGLRLSKKRRIRL